MEIQTTKRITVSGLTPPPVSPSLSTPPTYFSFTSERVCDKAYQNTLYILIYNINKLFHKDRGSIITYVITQV